jgi:putative ABC transport system permease protein
MLKNYFKIAWRNLSRNRGFTFTNLLGLTIGITCTIFIYLWVQDELTYDTFHKSHNNVYQVMANRNFNGQVMTDNNMVLPLASSLAAAYPQIKNAVATSGQEPHILTTNTDTKLKKKGYTVSARFFDVFSWEFTSGSASSALADPASIVLTNSAASALFGKSDPINKTIQIDNEQNYKVTAIVKDPPGNSTLQFDYIIPFNYSDPNVQQSMNEWTNSSWYVYLQVVPGTDINLLNKNITALKRQHSPEDKGSKYFAFAMNKWHLYSDFKEGKNTGGMIEYVRLFSIIGIIILLIACVNFMNFSTARSEKRAKEVGIRKTLGSSKKHLIWQFFSESMLLVIISFMVSMICVYFLLPSFNSLVNKNLSLPLSQLSFWFMACGIILFTGFVAGSYPALYLSSFNPVKVLKGNFSAGKKTVTPRHVLIVAQFVMSILLISATIIIYQQIQYVKNRDMGYNAANLIMIPTTAANQKNYTVLKEELLKTGIISSLTRTSSPITEVWWKTPGPEWQGKPANTDMVFSGMSAETGFTKTMGIQLLEGKDFSGTPSDSSVMLLNKAAVELMGLKKPVGMQMQYNKKRYIVAGITNNVVMESPYKPVDPMMMIYYPGYSNSIALRLNNNMELKKALGSIETVFKKYNPAFPFEYQFADQEFGKKFIAEEMINRITNLFAGLAIFICCIGLAGLASFTIEKRFREIGIRKVLGASVQEVLALISKEFLQLVLIAFFITVPVTWLLMNHWLQHYTYHVHISIWLFVSVGAFVLLLTLIIVSLNTIRAAVANPVKSLRTE